jgi:hypothetical protein
MSEKYVTVAGFTEPVGAGIARGRLESEGIPSFLTGELSVGAFAGLSNLGGKIELRVPAEHLARAVQILAECGARDNLSDEVRVEEDNEGLVWICPLCGDAVRAVLPVCPACHTPRGQTPAVDPANTHDDGPEEHIQAHAPKPPMEPPDRGVKKPGDVTAGAALPAEPTIESEDIDVPPLTTMVGDATARRAFLAALYGLILPVGILTLYSMWILLGLTFYRGELSSRGMRHLYLAVIFDGFFGLFALVVCAGILR